MANLPGYLDRNDFHQTNRRNNFDSCKANKPRVYFVILYKKFKFINLRYTTKTHTPQFNYNVYYNVKP